MRTLNFSQAAFHEELARFCTDGGASAEIVGAVAEILLEVKTHGDTAVAAYAEKFDRAKLRAAEFRVSAQEISSASRQLSAPEMAALRASHRAIRDFNRRAPPVDWRSKNQQGAWVGEKFDPIRRVGIYVPGGEVPLVSTVLMTVTLARLAKCAQIAVCTPASPEGKVSPAVLAALHLLRVTEVYRIGGVQAIGALAFGTATIPAVDKIFGPGNAYVCEAKRQVFGTVGVDSLPGPSEVMIIADESARADFAAADLLAQAEHGSGREKIYLVSTSQRTLDKIAFALDQQLPQLSRSEKTARVLREGFLLVKVASMAQAAEVANYVAPEHLELMVNSGASAQLLRKVTTAGAIMVGNFTPTALGDFVAGPSHVLPTGRAGRFSSGLRVADFLRRTSVIAYDARSVPRAALTVAAFARMEKLDGHGRSVELRTISGQG